mmetsp:Transcript_51064/g.136197  ORF Transcript_51064/g.136197 Transcript_51064/m.136197 type:complete len:259 (-) Transcript_51064:353-1129(-)
MEVCVPAEVVFEGQRWVSTGISKAADLVNGRAWIANFETACEKPRRVLQKSLTEGAPPEFRTGGLSNKDRNTALQMLVREGCPRPGKRVVLPTGDEVIFWFNVGPLAYKGNAKDRVFVTSARCPHQGVCLSEGELREIEDLAGVLKPVIRCPRHNRLFDVSTGEGQGNDGSLRTYPSRFFPEYKMFYVSIGVAGEERDMSVDAEVVDPARMQVDHARTLVPPARTQVEPARTLVPQMTMDEQLFTRDLRALGGLGCES